jgi:hypothetical protein
MSRSLQPSRAQPPGWPAPARHCGHDAAQDTPSPMSSRSPPASAHNTKLDRCGHIGPAQTPSWLVGERKEQCVDQRYHPYQRKQGAEPPCSLAAEPSGGGREPALRRRRSAGRGARLADQPG